MSESDSVVHQYLLTISAKLAKQFSKKKPGLAPWTGPSLEQLIDFYKRNCKEEPVSTTAPSTTETLTNGSCEASTPVPSVTNGVTKKKGKKRKLSEISVTVAEAPAAGKKKKKKKKVKKSKSPDVVEIIQVAEGDASKTVETPVETPAAPEPAVVETPAAAETPASEPAEQENISPNAESEEVVVSGGLVTSIQEEGEEERPNKKSKLKRKKSNGSFRRVKEEDVVIKKAELADNAFEAKGGADEYGYKANQILKFTKGKSFRHEKTKKKRGTYKGGAINMGVTSIKFDSDSD